MIDYVYNGKMQQNISISKMLRFGLTQGGGPIPRLTGGGNTTHIHQTNGSFIPFDETANKGIASGLLTCAAVLFASTDPNAELGTYVYHALSGSVNIATINNAREFLGNPPAKSIVVLYTFPNPSDDNYVASAQGIVNSGIPANQVLFAPNLPTSHFGSGGDFFIGV
ncbi:hypothetical protein [Catalinimonas niigatensis]|uniref:hypothetical protein n=1 Tax=Catalinimonas niigatensis TaxID=1397264 RepID=UPI00266562CA|nr:hypothetical protein [Catalinimonas niigatensis]WPP50822.1 hypothetical protein PZB72_00240 [Catalinimonas niigatensis]